MSCEEDDDWWDDPEPIVEIKQINIENTTISRKELLTIEEALKMCLDRKLERLNLILGQTNIYQVDDLLIVNDRYNVASNLVQIVEAFGMNISLVQVQGFKGKTYVISDKITQLLKMLGTTYNFSNALNILEKPQNVNLDSRYFYDNKGLEDVYDKELSGFLLDIKSKGFVSIQGVETIIDEVSQGIVSNNASVTQKLKKYLIDIKNENCKNNKNLQYGTVEILNMRARQMGYTVEKVVRDKEVQLVFARIDGE